MFKLWQDMAPVMGVSTVMRDVTLWAFTQTMFQEQEPTLKEFEAAMAALDMPVEAYLAQLHAIQVHDTRARLKALKMPTMVLAGADDILIPMNLSRELHSLIPGATFATAKGGHAFLWEFPAPFNEAALNFIAKHRG
jgi:pimeloyl-ACP methyl ester carboxylesterase